MEAATRGRKQKWKLKDAEGLGRKRRIEEAERRELHESDQGLDSGHGLNPGRKVRRIDQAVEGSPEIVPAKIRKKPCLGRVFFVLNFKPISPIEVRSTVRFFHYPYSVRERSWVLSRQSIRTISA